MTPTGLHRTHGWLSPDGPDIYQNSRTRIRSKDISSLQTEPLVEQYSGMRRLEDYFQEVRRFKEECAVFVNLTAGSPARATALNSIQVENGPEGRGQRGMFIVNGIVDFATSYHKGVER